MIGRRTIETAFAATFETYAAIRAQSLVLLDSSKVSRTYDNGQHVHACVQLFLSASCLKCLKRSARAFVDDSLLDLRRMFPQLHRPLECAVRLAGAGAMTSMRPFFHARKLEGESALLAHEETGDGRMRGSAIAIETLAHVCVYVFLS